MVPIFVFLPRIEGDREADAVEVLTATERAGFQVIDLRGSIGILRSASCGWRRGISIPTPPPTA